MCIKFRPETYEFSIPKIKTFAVFFSTFIFLGLSEAYWVVYPLFVHTLSETIFQMGLVLASSAVLICLVTFLVNWLSDIKEARAEFAIIGATLSALWYFAISSASTMYQIVVLSPLSGLAGAFSLSWFAHYGDSFSKEHYASILVMMEVGLMIGRIINLAPTYIFICDVMETSPAKPLFSLCSSTVRSLNTNLAISPAQPLFFLDLSDFHVRLYTRHSGAGG